MIKVGENPQNVKGINKFIAKGGEGQRGKIVALHSNKKQAIILAMNSSWKKGDVKWGEFYLIKEFKEDEYPKVVKKVASIPNTKEWTTMGN